MTGFSRKLKSKEKRIKNIKALNTNQEIIYASKEYAM